MINQSLRLAGALVCLLAVTTAPAHAEGKAPKKEAAKPAINWVEVESTGIIGTAKQGALEKTLWAGQNRSEIEYLLARLPADPALRSVFSLQRRLLLSRTDTSLIVNDIGPLRGNDMLIQRIRKLMQMGLYDDAWELYTQKAEDPYDVSIAQLGLTLMIMRGDLATACLEEKVFASRYPDDKFFKTLDRACSETLGGGKPVFDDNEVLQSVYNQPNYSVSATAPNVLQSLSDLELALVLANGKIRYDGLSRDTLSKTPPSLVALYTMDKNLPEGALSMIRGDLQDRGVRPYLKAIAKSETITKIRSTKDKAERWPLVESALKMPPRRLADLIPLADYVAEGTPSQISTDTLLKSLGVLLTAGRELPEFWLAAAQKQAPEKPIIYIYLQAFSSLTPTKNISLEQKQVLAALRLLKHQDADQIIAIIESLDNTTNLAQKSLSAYDKDLGLTLQNNYVMPSMGLNILLETAPEKKQSGITILAVLNSLAAKPDNMYSGSMRKALYGMLNIGLIEDAKTTGSEIVASVLNKY